MYRRSMLAFQLVSFLPYLPFGERADKRSSEIWAQGSETA